MALKQKQSTDVIIAADDEDLHGYIVELCKRHLKEYPQDGYIWSKYACALTALSRFEDSIYALNQALLFCDQKDHEVIFAAMGEIHFRRPNYLEAEKYFLRAIELNPDAIYIHDYLGVCTFRRGDLNLAESRLRRALDCSDLDDMEDEILFNLGGVLIAQERYVEAADCYKRALELGHKSAKVRLRDLEEIFNLKKKQLNP